MRRFALVALLAACPSPPTPGATDSATTTTTTTTAGEASTGTTDACMRSGDCETDGICVAPYGPDPEGSLGGERGPALCEGEDACIGALDLSRWCFDHQGCCGDLRCRTADGICEPPDSGGSTGTTGTTGTTGSTGTTTDQTGGASTTTGTGGSTSDTGTTTNGSTSDTG